MQVFFSSDPDRSNAFASTLGLRGYGSVDAFINGETARDDGVEAVSIVTPNHLHADAAIKCLDAGLHVICDKPLSATPAQAARIAQAVENSSAQFFLTHTRATPWCVLRVIWWQEASLGHCD